MITVAAADKIVMSQAKDYGAELVPFEQTLGRVLAEDIFADRDLPPCNRVTVDGIAIRFAALANDVCTFRIAGTIAAGDQPIEITTDNECVEIMTGAALPASADTVVRYEDVAIKDGIATVLIKDIRQGQNIHPKGKDKKQGDIVLKKDRLVDATIISMAASVGKAELLVKKLPRVVIISTGDELVSVTTQPTPYQVRSSNSHTVRAVLQQYCIQAHTLHLPDEPQVTNEKLNECLAGYDVIVLSGGVSMGKFDYVPRALSELGVDQLFHKVQQRPGKPFWFGVHKAGAIIFAFPGNPVSTFMCLHRYLIPWLEACMALPAKGHQYAILERDVIFAPSLQYFIQVKLNVNDQAQLIATPIEGNGSGDFANLTDSDAFMELPLEESNFKSGSIYRIWPFKRIV
jgi:molybdopterin molybdotransferase